MTRITKKQLQARIETINSILGMPETPFTVHEDGTRTYGGYGVGKMSEEGGTWSVVWNGHIPARDAYERISAFIAGLTFTK